VADFSEPTGRTLHRGDVVIVEVATRTLVNVTQSPSASEEHPDGSP
jgi:hypothetical protein